MENEFYSVKADSRGELYEIINMSGTQFISTTHPGVIRGNHYHKTKTEWFTVLYGSANLYTRDRATGEKVSYAMDGRCPQIVAILPNVTHAIENVGDTDLVLLVQSNQVYDEGHSDTYSEKV